MYEYINRLGRKVSKGLPMLYIIMANIECFTEGDSSIAHGNRHFR